MPRQRLRGMYSAVSAMALGIWSAKMPMLARKRRIVRLAAECAKAVAAMSNENPKK